MDAIDVQQGPPDNVAVTFSDFVVREVSFQPPPQVPAPPGKHWEVSGQIHSSIGPSMAFVVEVQAPTTAAAISYARRYMKGFANGILQAVEGGGFPE